MTACLFQFCANDPEVFVQAALLAQGYCDGIDLNLGCPQMIAKRGKLGPSSCFRPGPGDCKAALLAEWGEVWGQGPAGPQAPHFLWCLGGRRAPSG